MFSLHYKWNIEENKNEKEKSMLAGSSLIYYYLLQILFDKKAFRFQRLDGLALDLAYTLACKTEFLAYFFESECVGRVDTEV